MAYFEPVVPQDSEFEKEVDLLSLVGPEGHFDHDHLRSIQDLARSVSEGKSIIARLDPEEELGRLQGGPIYVEASLVLGAIEAASGRMLGQPGNALQRQTRGLKDYAEATGLWLGEDRIANAAQEWLPRGQEAGVYEDEGGASVTKVIRFNRFSRTPLEFLDDRIALYNYLFPDTPYELIGFTAAYNDLAFVVRQPFVQGHELIAEVLPLLAERRIADAAEAQRAVNEKLKLYMQEHYAMSPAQQNGTTYFNTFYSIKDLHGHNILVAADGGFHIIDAAPALNIPDTGGSRLYQPFAVWSK